MPPTIKEQVDKQIATVLGAMNEARFELSKRDSTEANEAAKALRSLGRVTKAWAKRGQEWAAAGTEPPGKGWAGWVEGGNRHMAGHREIEGLGKRGRLENIQVTVEQVLKDANPASGLKTAAAAVGEAANSLVDPIFGKVLVLAVVAGAGLYAYYRFAR